jgi:hypothetical protein
VVFKGNKVMRSVEFSGDMYPGGHYEAMIKKLKKVKNVIDFGARMIEFDEEEGFNYIEREDRLVHQVSKAQYIKPNEGFVFDEDTYYDKYFSDYVFLKNCSGVDLPVIDIEGKDIILKDGEIATFEFGRFYKQYKNGKSK